MRTRLRSGANPSCCPACVSGQWAGADALCKPQQVPVRILHRELADPDGVVSAGIPALLQGEEQFVTGLYHRGVDLIDVVDVDGQVDPPAVGMGQFRARVEAIAGSGLLQHQISAIAGEVGEALPGAGVTDGEAEQTGEGETGTEGWAGQLGGT